MSKIVFPLKAAPRRRWMVEFAGGLVRGLLTFGASAVLTVVTLLWMRANGHLG